MVPVNSIVKCPWCMAEYSLKDWDENTHKECKSRETRRAFRSLQNESVWKKESKNFYKCPSCGQWSRGNKLRIANSNDRNLSSLGGESLFEIVNSENN